MWSSVWGDEGPDEELQRRLQPPENEVPVSLPDRLLLARTDDVAVALLGLRVFTTGVSFELAVRLRPSARSRFGSSLDELIWRRGRRGSRFLLGVELADGRRIGGALGGDGGNVVFHERGGSGGEASVEQSWWLSPLPAEGPLRFVVRCPELGIAEASAVLDGSAVRRAADDVVTLWPWEPPPEHRAEPPAPPDLPADSWFARP